MSYHSSFFRTKRKPRRTPPSSSAHYSVADRRGKRCWRFDRRFAAARGPSPPLPPRLSSSLSATPLSFLLLRRRRRRRRPRFTPTGPSSRAPGTTGPATRSSPSTTPPSSISSSTGLKSIGMPITSGKCSSALCCPSRQVGAARIVPTVRSPPDTAPG